MIVRCILRWRRPAVWVVAGLTMSSIWAFRDSDPSARAPAIALAPDDNFAARHPRLLFSASDLPALRARVHNGGADDDAYAFIRQQAYDVYLSVPFDSLLQDDAALEPMLNLALVSHCESSVDSELVNLGRQLTLHIARNWNRDTDPWGSSLRLRAMAIGFDHFFVNASPAERNEIRAEAESYMAYMTYNLNFDIWRHQPYVSNKTAMVAGALGLASICFQEEMSANTTGVALIATGTFVDAWRAAHLASDGCYSEGSLYVGWSMRNLIYYFHARKRFDGLDYSLDPAIRAVERWVPYELDPRGGGRANNIQDQTDYYRGLAWHTTYWAWAQSEWGSALAAYMWEHTAGALGIDMLDENDKAATVLWHTGVVPQNPGAVLDRSHVWEDRGLYYFRTGWPDGAASDDVVFSFYCGEFRGGHAQEDQGQFTLAAYGEKLIFDHGAGNLAKQSEAHNLVRIDGYGQHNAGNSIGTDGRMTDFITTGFSDYVRGDATLAYSTHSPYNNPGVPYAWSNWNWGLSGANPVERALRSVVAVHAPGVAPYFVVRDDVEKDGALHRYDWCMHAPASASIDTTGEAVVVTSGGASLRVYPVYPLRNAVATTVSNFDNDNPDPDSKLLKISVTAVDPHFTLLLLPLPLLETPPVMTRRSVPGGAGVRLAWQTGAVDDVLMRTPATPGGDALVLDVFPGPASTDATLAVVRREGFTVTGYTLVDATWLMSGTVLLAAVEDGPASLIFDGTDVHLGRPDAHFRVRADLVSGVYYRGQPVPTFVDGDYLVSALPTRVADTPRGSLQLRSYPNPFNPSVRISFVNPVRTDVRATIHDAAGRRVVTLVSRVMEAGAQTLEWDGRDDAARPAASGVYFLRVSAGAVHATTKLVLLR